MSARGRVSASLGIAACLLSGHLAAQGPSPAGAPVAVDPTPRVVIGPENGIVTPFLLGDAFKLALAAGLMPVAWYLLRRR